MHRARRVQSQVVVAMRTAKQQGNWAAVTRCLRSWIFQNGRMKLSCCVMCVCVSLLLQASFGCISEQQRVLRWTWQSNKMHSALWILFACINNLSRDNFRKKNHTCKYAFLFLVVVFFTSKLWNWSYHNDEPYRLKRRWVTRLELLLLFATRSL